jgi:hypothetical protein
MPRLAPDGTRCREHRVTMGTAERKMLAITLKEQRADRAVKVVSAFAPAIMIGAAGFGAFYFLSKSIDNIARAWAGMPLDNIQQSVRKGTEAVKGLNADGSYPTILTVETGRYPEGKVRVWVPGLTGGFGSTAFLATINKKEDILVVGNFNKDAKFVDELSEGWLPYSQYKEATEDNREYVS